jgi:hypothetical protein
MRSSEPEEEQTEVAPEEGTLVRNTVHYYKRFKTYRAIKLRSLSAAALDDIVNTNVGTRERLLPRAARARDRAVTAVAVAVAVSIGVCKATMRAVTTALSRRAGTPSMTTSRSAPSSSPRLRRLSSVPVAGISPRADCVVNNRWEHLKGFVQVWARAAWRDCGLVRSRRVIFGVEILC